MSRVKRIFGWILRLLHFLWRQIVGKPFCGVWATFAYLDDTCSAILDLKGQGYQKITTHSPCPREELQKALREKASPLPGFSLVFGFLGLVAAAAMITWMTLQWVLPVSMKEIVSIFPVVIIGFELLVLFAVVGTLVGMVLLGLMEARRSRRPGSFEFSSYRRFSQDRFGVVVNCDKGDFNAIEQIMRNASAEEVHVEV